jgi:hypothetical protein
VDLGFDAHGEYADPSLFRATITQRGMTRVFDGSSMRVRNNPSGYVSAGRDDIPLRAGAEVIVGISLQTPSGPVSSQVVWTPQDDWLYGVAAIVSTNRPVGFCFNVVHATALPGAVGAPADTLFIVHSGLPKDAIC